MVTPAFPLRLGTRESPLALTQAHMVRGALCTAHGWSEDSVAIVPITTSGDRIQDRALAEVGGKALWTKELDLALGEDRIDFAVHSMKDVETVRPAEIAIAAMLERADVRDRLIGAESIESIPRGGRVGTSSPRRAAQMLRLRPDLETVLFRGNVGTRLARIERGEADATLLAAAGLDRLGHPSTGTAISADVMLPAPAQGAIGIECLGDRTELLAMLGAIDHAPTHACVSAERRLLARLGADCRSPVAALAIIADGVLRIRAEILSPAGEHISEGETQADPGDLQAIDALGDMLLAHASPTLRALFTG